MFTQDRIPVHGCMEHDLSTLSVVLICHDQEQMMLDKIDELQEQSRPPDELIVCLSSSMPNAEKYREKGFLVSDDRNDKGYWKRHIGGMVASGEWVIFVNYDDLHSPELLEKVMAKTSEADVVYWHTKSGKYMQTGQKFVGFDSGAENWIVKTELFRRVGGYAPFIGDYTATNTGSPPDSKLIGAVNATVPRVVCVPETLLEIR